MQQGGRSCAERREKQREQGIGRRTTPLSLKSLCGSGVPSSHPSLGLSVFFLFSCLFSFFSFFRQKPRGEETRARKFLSADA